MNNTTDGERFKHKSFRVETTMQMWAEQNIGKVGYTIFHVADFPGAQPAQVAEAKTLLDVEILMTTFMNMFARNMIEGSEIDVDKLRREK